jgi:cytochrome c oxidase subunit 2
MRRLPRLATIMVLPALTTGCRDWQSALVPRGPQASNVLELLIIFVAVCGVIWLLVVLASARSLARRQATMSDPLAPDPASERRLTWIVGLCIAATVAVIALLTTASYVVTRDLSGPPPDALSLRLRGYQWWWEVTYLDPRPDHMITLANEIHVPVGKPVRIELEAADVIHSFWVPSLAGKLDLIPGRQNEITIRADRPGIYRGQCAEFCGLQHAHMSLHVVAEDHQAFEEWRDAQLRPADEPRDPELAAGAKVFASKPCAACHTVRGTPAAGTLGPDLTHVGTRRYIAAGLLPTTRGSLAAWIADPQMIKPGSNMPMVALTADELRAVSAYMASLK